MLDGVLSSIIDFILPHKCISCSELTEQEDGLCTSCFSKLNFISYPYCKICGFLFKFDIEEKYECKSAFLVHQNMILLEFCLTLLLTARSLLMGLNIMIRQAIQSYYFLGIKTI